MYAVNAAARFLISCKIKAGIPPVELGVGLLATRRANPSTIVLVKAFTPSTMMRASVEDIGPFVFLKMSSQKLASPMLPPVYIRVAGMGNLPPYG